VDRVPVMELCISVQQHDDGAVIQLGGEVDLATCPQLRAALVELVDRGFDQLTIEGVRDARSGGYTVQPAAQRAGGSEDIPEPVQQPAPAA